MKKQLSGRVKSKYYLGSSILVLINIIVLLGHGALAARARLAHVESTVA